MNDMTPEELAEVIARYRYNAVHDKNRIEQLTNENIELRKELAKLQAIVEKNA